MVFKVSHQELDFLWSLEERQGCLAAGCRGLVAGFLLSMTLRCPGSLASVNSSRIMSYICTLVWTFPQKHDPLQVTCSSLSILYLTLCLSFPNVLFSRPIVDMTLGIISYLNLVLSDYISNGLKYCLTRKHKHFI